MDPLWSEADRNRPEVYLTGDRLELTRGVLPLDSRTSPTRSRIESIHTFVLPDSLKERVHPHFLVPRLARGATPSTPWTSSTRSPSESRRSRVWCDHNFV